VGHRKKSGGSKNTVSLNKIILRMDTKRSSEVREDTGVTGER